MKHLILSSIIIVVLWKDAIANVRFAKVARHQYRSRADGRPAFRRLLNSWTCSGTVPVINCSNQKGIFYKLNDGYLTSVSVAEDFNPLTVPPHSKLSISVCNFMNKRAKYKTISDPLIPTLVGDVGEYAEVRVRVINSANINVTKKLTIKEKSARSSLIDTIISGTISKGAAVDVIVRNSGNVFLGNFAEKLFIRKSQLIAGLFSGADDAMCVRNTCLRGSIRNSANVVGLDSEAELKISDNGYLMGPAFVARCMAGGSQTIVIRSSANVRGVRSMRANTLSELIDAPLQTNAVYTGKLFVDIRNSANVRVTEKLSMKRSFFASSLVSMDNSSMTNIRVAVRNVGNSHSESTVFNEAETFRNMIDGMNTKKGNFQLSIRNTGNMHAKRSVTLKSVSQCIDSLIDLKNMTVDTTVVASLAGACNMRTAKLRLNDNSDVISVIIQAFKSFRSTYTATIVNTANTRANQVNIGKGGLIQDVLKILAPVDSVHVSADIKRSANLLCIDKSSIVRMDSGQLVSDIINLPENAPATINAKASLEYVGNLRVTSKGDTSLILRVFTNDAGVDDLDMWLSTVGKVLKC